MQHIIKKQIINLALPVKADAFGIQQSVSEYYTRDVVPLMENVFDGLSAKGEIIQIDYLEIDLGILSEKEVKRGKWNEAILSKIREQLYQQIKAKREEENTKHTGVSFNNYRQWLFYMQKGYLPWNVLQVSDAWHEKVLETLAVDFGSISELRSIIKHHPFVVRRIALQHSEIFLQQLVAVLTAGNQQGLPKLVQQFSLLLVWLNNGNLTEANQKAAIQKIWEQLIQVAAQVEKALTPLQLVEKILERELTSSIVVENIITTHAGELRAILPILKKIIANKKTHFPKQTDDAIVDPATVETKTNQDISAAEEEGVFVQHAGMVLIHPFISALFNRLQWVNQGAFKDERSRQKALYLLHYAATGRGEAEEYELVVPKILCNWPLAMPVEKDMEWSKAELNEADSMLQAAIEQWTVLQHTSPDGLREGFLQRRGKFFTRNDKQYLQVERGALDVLLDQLPWNLGIIKLPWMKEILWVEWR
ncbi:contractile injection system tape measure protein [Agriterribacter sp.]|uniref:contractile injection system tape measure protein n=1 Tax=Agriterribacter sp. TaxID=2821509 RepID=UPI002CF22FFD|nr:contractile injection system tape measure protein [Agriterribacter sp.]HRO45272.1 contractile injection system tape measure protein [Agriterribacter sp.]HRQ16875.1 contractile injection system tape measure protein [Agriterribacter sp.]